MKSHSSFRKFFVYWYREEIKLYAFWVYDIVEHALWKDYMTNIFTHLLSCVNIMTNLRIVCFNARIDAYSDRCHFGSTVSKLKMEFQLNSNEMTNSLKSLREFALQIKKHFRHSPLIDRIQWCVLFGVSVIWFLWFLDVGLSGSDARLISFVMNCISKRSKRGRKRHGCSVNGILDMLMIVKIIISWLIKYRLGAMLRVPHLVRTV